MEHYQTILQKQRDFFLAEHTKSYESRITALKKLKEILKSNEQGIYEALFQDLKKSEFETYLTEIGILYTELNYFIKNLKKLMKRQKVTTNFANVPAKSFIQKEPLGNVLVIGAWNYPVHLSILPALSAIAAGCTVILKPSELASESSKIIAKLINENFEQELFYVIEGGIAETTALLDLKFDKIFFTGSSHIGKIVYQKAAKHLTPVTLELGGKSPCFVFADCDLKVTAKRLLWAKLLNAGQTCVAPDYVFVEDSIKDDFIQTLIAEITEHYHNISVYAKNYMAIINEKNFKRLVSLIDPQKVIFGGEYDESRLFIAPTLVEADFDDKVMEDEIFGPILPIIAFDNLNWAIDKVKSGEKPLSLYAFGKNKEKYNRLLNEISSGSVAINDPLMQMSNHHLPFGGVGFSGIGNYHGKAGFDCFSHHKSILVKGFLIDPPIKYAPYTWWKKWLLKLFQG